MPLEKIQRRISKKMDKISKPTFIVDEKAASSLSNFICSKKVQDVIIKGSKSPCKDNSHISFNKQSLDAILKTS